MNQLLAGIEIIKSLGNGAEKRSVRLWPGAQRAAGQPLRRCSQRDCCWWQTRTQITAPRYAEPFPTRLRCGKPPAVRRH